MVKVSAYPLEIVHRITGHLLSVLHLGDLGGNIDRRRRKNASGILLHRALLFLVALPLLDLDPEDTRRDTVDLDPSHDIIDIDMAVRDGDHHHLLLLREEARNLIMKGLMRSQFLQLDNLCHLALQGPLLHMKLV